MKLDSKNMIQSKASNCFISPNKYVPESKMDVSITPRALVMPDEGRSDDGIHSHRTTPIKVSYKQKEESSKVGTLGRHIKYSPTIVYTPVLTSARIVRNGTIAASTLLTDNIHELNEKFIRLCLGEDNGSSTKDQISHTAYCKKESKYDTNYSKINANGSMPKKVGNRSNYGKKKEIYQEEIRTSQQICTKKVLIKSSIKSHQEESDTENPKSNRNELLSRKEKNISKKDKSNGVETLWGSFRKLIWSERQGKTIEVTRSCRLAAKSVGTGILT